jgi:ribonuclease J
MMEKHTMRETPIRIIPLGGVEEIGRNMTIVECGNDIVVIDAGLEFPIEETPGIDYIIPNTKYLESRKHKIRALIISHGHLDHTGAIPYIMDMIGNPTIYTTKLTKAMILKKQEEFPHAAKLRIEEVRSGDKIKLGALAARFFDITHTIPDAIGIIIETHLGNIIYPGDFKIELDAKGNPLQIDSYIKIGKENNLALLLESTNAEVPGFSIPEKTVHRNLEKIISEAKGRVITGTFSSLLERIIELIKIAEKYDRKVVIDGFSMKTNVEIAKELGYFKPKENAIISVERINDYPPEKILAICTGAQGEENAALMRIANRKHKHIKIQKEDTIVLSSSIIPGNERSIQNLKDNLARQGAKIIHYKVADVHASGHAYQEELKMMVKMINPKFLIPIHGYYFMLKNNADLAESIGMRGENIVPPLRNGSIIEIAKNKIQTLKESAPANYVMVDGLGVNDVKEVVLRDRQMLAQDGIFVVITVINSQTGKVQNSPDIISRGFIYLRESQELLKQTRQLIKKTVEEATGKMHPINVTYVKDLLRERIGKFLFQKTKRRPMVLPVLIEV